MNVHEYQAKAVLKEFGVPVSKGAPAFTPDEAQAAAEELGGPVWVVKAQIHAGGRGKGRFTEPAAGEKGGVRLASSIEEVKRHAREMLGHTLVTAQTGPSGKLVNRIYVEEGCQIARELYLSMLVDRETARVALVVSTEGGMDIETVAHDTPDKIVTLTIDPATGVMPHHGRRVARALGLTGDLAQQADGSSPELYAAFVAKDMSLLEINPLVVTEGRAVDLSRRQGRLRRQRALSPSRHAANCATSPRRMRRRSRPRSTISPTSRSTARSAAWSTAPASPWRPWTSSSSTARRRRTSSTSAAAPPRRRSRPRSRSSPSDPEREGHPGQHLRRHHALRHDRRGRGRGGEGGRPRGAAGGAARRHQRRARQADHRRVRAQRDRPPTISTTPRRRSSRP